MKERIDLMYLTKRRTFFKGWIEPINDKEGKIFIDKVAHPNLSKGGTLPPGHMLVPIESLRRGTGEGS